LREVLERIESQSSLDEIVKMLMEKKENPYTQVEHVLKEVLK
jgi:hypothetical protein